MGEGYSPDEDKQDSWDTKEGAVSEVPSALHQRQNSTHLMKFLLRAERYIRHSAGIVITKLHRISVVKGREE